MKVIFINARFLTQPITGVQRFAIEICKELKKIGLPIQLLAPHDVIDQELSDYFEVKVIGKKNRSPLGAIRTSTLFKKTTISDTAKFVQYCTVILPKQYYNTA